MGNPLRLFRCGLWRLLTGHDGEAGRAAEAKELSAARHGLANAATTARAISHQVRETTEQVIGSERFESFAQQIRGGEK